MEEFNYRCSCCNQKIYTDIGKFLPWDSTRIEDVKVCQKCSDTMKKESIEFVEEICVELCCEDEE
jgi:hypothetical protein